MKFTALNANLVIRIQKRPAEEKTASGIIVSTEALRDGCQWLEGVVEGVGPSVESDALTEGCTVRFDRWSGKELDSDDTSQLLCVPENSVYVVVSELNE